ncbi:MAG: TonB-dependent receptor domain-containing protein [Oceanicaulis sp.]
MATRPGVLILGVLALIAAPLSAAAEAQPDPAPESGSDRQVYPRSFFDRFNPQTARDIVDRIPGFSFDPGDELRGFGGAAGNVLVDGARPSSKGGGIAEALSRIPANDVERVVVIRGAAGASEAAGQAVVANIIRAGRARSATWRAEIERSSEGVTYPALEGSLTARLGDWSTSTKLNGFWEQFDLVGRRDRFDSQGDLVLAQTEDRPSVFTQGFASTEASRPLAGGTLTLNARAGLSGFFPVTDRLQFDAREPDGAPDGRVYIDFDSVQTSGEASIDWTRTYPNDWTFKVIGLANASALDEDSIIREERPLETIAGGSRFTNRQRPIETILRTTFARGGERRLKPEFGLEAAYNRLDSEFAFFIRDAGGQETAIDLPAADVMVEEFRGEVFTNLIWAVSPKWTLESGLAVEASEISVSGDADNSQTFVFAKPFASLIYQASPSLQLRTGLRRSVGQLDFGDFAASAEGEQDRQFGGNPDLGPDQTWRASAAMDWRNDGVGALNIELFHEWRTDVLEQLVLPSGAFGVANAGEARVWGAELTGSLQLQPLIPGGLLEVNATLQDSEFEDPLTGSARSLSGIDNPAASIAFRQDLASRQLSWGVTYTVLSEERNFFADEVSHSETGGRIEVFAETTRWLGVKSRLAVRNLGERNFLTERAFFAPDRSGAFIGSERVDRDRGVFVELSFEGQS